MRPLALAAVIVGSVQPAIASLGGHVLIPTLAREGQVTFVQSIRTSYFDVIDALDRNGYQIVSVTNTMLNRVVIRARNEHHLREIVLSRASGHILRDGIMENYLPPDAAPPVPIERILRNTEGGIGVVGR